MCFMTSRLPSHYPSQYCVQLFTYNRWSLTEVEVLAAEMCAVLDISSVYWTEVLCFLVVLMSGKLPIFNLLAQIQPKDLRPAPFPEQAGFGGFLFLQKGLFEAITPELWATICWKSVD